MARIDIDQYMNDLQIEALRGIDHKRLRNDNIMFRIVDAEPLVPRYRVEIGVVIDGQPHLGSTMREKDPKMTGRRLAQWVNKILDAKP